MTTKSNTQNPNLNVSFFLFFFTITYLLLIPILAVAQSHSSSTGTNAPVISTEQKQQIENLTLQLSSLIASYQNAPINAQNEFIPQIIAKAKQRKQLLLKIIEHTPGTAFNVALPKHLLQSLPDTIQSQIEQDVEMEGEMKFIYVDHENPKLSPYAFYLETPSGQLFTLHFVNRPKGLLSGSQVRASGLVLFRSSNETTDGSGGDIILNNEQNLLLLTSQESSTTTSTTSPTTILPNTFGDQKTLVMLVNFQNDALNKPWTAEQAQNLVFNTVSDFYYENSYGQTWLTGDVLDWNTLPLDNTNCNSTQISNEADSAAINAGVDLSAYTRFIYIFPYTSSCGWSGAGTIGGYPSQSWINGKLELQVIGHELGHNFGLQHSHSLECGTTTLGSNCQSFDYGDHFDIMGNFRAGHFNAFQKSQLGWLNYGNSPSITTVTTSGTYTIEPYETGISGTKSIKVLKNSDPNTNIDSWYYLEFRQADGFDSFLAGNDNLLNGVLFHSATDSDINSSHLLDITPASNTNGYDDWEDTALALDNSYTDPDAGVTISTTWTDGAGATVSVNFGPQAPSCNRANPEVSISPTQSQWVTAGTAVDYTVNVTNHDNDACGTSLFNLQTNHPTEWSASFSNPSLSLAPGESASTTLTVISPVSTADGFYSIDISVFNNNDSIYNTSTSITYVVTNDTGNQAPIAVDDSAETTENTLVIIPVLANDSDPDADALTISSVTQAANGTVTINNNGTLNYTPKKRFKEGSDNFSYQISDGIDSATAYVYITVTKDTSSGTGGGKGGGKGKK